MADWYSVMETAAELGVNDRTVYGIIDRGELTAYRFGRVIRVKNEDLNAYLERARIKPGELGHLIPPRYDGPRRLGAVS